jgi:hypothetical protein
MSMLMPHAHMHMQERKSLVHGCLPAFPLVVVSQDGNGWAPLIIAAEVI